MEFLMQKTKVNVIRCWFNCLALLTGVIWSPTLHGEWRDDIGHTKLVSILGSSAPNGAGVPISIVEAGEGAASNFSPNVADVDFSEGTDPLGTAVNFINGSISQGNGISNHANSQARSFFGNTTSLAPAANTVTIYQANNYLNNILNMSSSNASLPDIQNFRVQNFSWVATYATPNDDTPIPTLSELNNDREALRRFDYVIDTNNITASVGVGNGGTIANLLSHSYNAIAVGLTNGNHSRGPTTLNDYGTGRIKPELVVPRNDSSAATASVSSAATFLHSSNAVLGTDAAQSETLKAILLAGATKDEFPSWSQVDTDGEWHPLDTTYGAGELNIYNSYLTVLGGQTMGSTSTPALAASHGWDYQAVQPGTGNELLYDFVIPTGSVATELSIVMTWNAKIEAPFNTGDPLVADLNLELVDVNGVTVDFNINDGFVDGLSQSDVDNVEHLYLTDLASGTYTLKVTSEDIASDFGIAWRTSTRFEVASADFDGGGDTNGADFLAWQRGFGKLVGAARADGDADGDGDVDGDDLAIFSEVFGGGEALLSSSLLLVPEPLGGELIGMGILLVFSLRNYRLCRARN